MPWSGENPPPPLPRTNFHKNQISYWYQFAHFLIFHQLCDFLRQLFCIQIADPPHPR